MEGNPEPALNQVGDEASGPEIGGETVGGRFLSQPLADELILFGRQKPGASRRRFGGQGVIAVGAMSGHPLGHGDGVDTQSDGDGGLRPSIEYHLNRSTPHGFQFGSRSFASHELESNNLAAGHQ
jgi:hypothetical protein